MELLLSISTLRRSSAKTITAVIPYYGYGITDKSVGSKNPICNADVADMIAVMGCDHVISVDFHSEPDFFNRRVSVDNLKGGLIFKDHMIANNLLDDFNGSVVISPDTAGIKRAEIFQLEMKAHGFENVSIGLISERSI